MRIDHNPIHVPAPSAQRSESAFAFRPAPALISNRPALQAPAVIPPADYAVGRFQVLAVAGLTVRQAEPKPDYNGVMRAPDVRRVAMAAWSTELGANGRITPVPTLTVDGPR